MSPMERSENIFHLLLRHTDQSDCLVQVANKEAEISDLNTVIAEKDKTIANLHAKGKLSSLPSTEVSRH